MVSFALGCLTPDSPVSKHWRSSGTSRVPPVTRLSPDIIKVAIMHHPPQQASSVGCVEFTFIDDVVDIDWVGCAISKSNLSSPHCEPSVVHEGSCGHEVAVPS